MVEIVETGTFQGCISKRKATGLDDVDRDREAGAKTQNRSDVLSDIRLEKGKPHRCESKAENVCTVC